MTEINDNEDENLFAKAMLKSGTKKLNNSCLADPSEIDYQANALNKLSKINYQKRRENAQKKIASNNVSGLSNFSVEGIDALEKVEYNLYLLQKKTRRKLQFLKKSESHYTDLHGLYIDEAKQKLYHFIKYASNNNIKYVQIIHGKSTASANNKNTLKSHCAHWLKQMSEVVAFCSAASVNARKEITSINYGAINALLK